MTCAAMTTNPTRTPAEMFRPAERIHPGEILMDELLARGWSCKLFAQLIRRPIREITMLTDEQIDVTPELAHAIAVGFGHDVGPWMALQMAWEAAQTKGGDAREVQL